MFVENKSQRAVGGGVTGPKSVADTTPQKLNVH
jgi:hypothetical protein